MNSFFIKDWNLLQTIVYFYLSLTLMSGSSENGFCADGAKEHCLLNCPDVTHLEGRKASNGRMKGGLSWMRPLFEPDIVSLK